MNGEPASRLTRLSLSDFRSYAGLTLETAAACCALIGDNGAGKTNLLEALSLFAPGRGLRRAEFTAMARIGGPGTFAVAAELTDAGGLDVHRLGVGLSGLDAEGKQARQNRLDGGDAGSAARFAEFLRIVWLIPDMDGLFRGAAGDRRRFLDRLVTAVDSTHTGRASAFERALRQRNRILEDEPQQTAWLDAVEHEAAELAVSVALARADLVEQLQELIDGRDSATATFPSAGLALRGPFEDLLTELGPTETAERYRLALRDQRARDRAAGRTLFGPQASDLAVLHLGKGIPAEQGSTGEQKALLISLVLAHARLVRNLSGIAPLVLLDEVAAHLDAKRRAALYRELAEIGGQVWMTGTDAAFFAEMVEGSERFLIEDGKAKRL